MQTERHSANHRRSRRRFLRGASFALALPWLESIPTLGATTGESGPVRFGCLFFSNGVEPEHWWARGDGPQMELGRALKPMVDLREQMVLIHGLFNRKANDHPSPHMGRMANLLSGGWVSEDPSVIRVGKSFDQVMADRLREKTELPSLVLGIEPMELRLEDGLSMIYGSSISWSTPTKPATKEIYPARVFDQIVGNHRNREVDRSILDEVLEDTRRVRANISQSDQHKLEEYTESIRSIEQRIDRAAKQRASESPDARDAVSKLMTRPEDSLPQDVPQHMQLMLDLIVLAFQLNKTRVATCMLNNDLSQMNFNFLKGVEGSLHLDLTHNGRDPELESMYLRTNQFHLKQFAYLCKRMQSIQEGDQTLLDRSVLMACSSLFNGDTHQADELPFLLAGRAGGALQPGRVLDFRDQPEDERRACNLYMSIMDWMGLEMAQFGDARSKLATL